ncbi:MAG: hypothetical protein LC670_05615, partial [Flavobacteriales bacterium]|nr:hypothetical protein [Flavobacteriales bacterium]
MSNYCCAQVIINQPQKKEKAQEAVEEVEPLSPQEREKTPRTPRQYSGHWDLSFHMVFPHGDFHSSDIDDSGTGNALQGAGGSLGRYIPFKEGSNLGAYMSVGYFSNRIRGLEEALSETLDNIEGERSFAMDSYNPRYEIMPASMGVAYESGFDKVNVYARLLVNLTGSFINRFSYRIDGTDEVIMRYPLEWTTGYTVELGLNVGNELSLGVAWNYFGAAEFSPSPALQNVFPPGAEVLNDLNFQR